MHLQAFFLLSPSSPPFPPALSPLSTGSGTSCAPPGAGKARGWEQGQTPRHRGVASLSLHMGRKEPGGDPKAGPIRQSTVLSLGAPQSCWLRDPTRLPVAPCPFPSLLEAARMGAEPAPGHGSDGKPPSLGAGLLTKGTEAVPLSQPDPSSCRGRTKCGERGGSGAGAGARCRAPGASGGREHGAWRSACPSICFQLLRDGAWNRCAATRSAAAVAPRL